MAVMLALGRLLLKSSLPRSTLLHLSHTARLCLSSGMITRSSHLARLNRDQLNRIGTRFVHVTASSSSSRSIAPVQADESSLQSEVQKSVLDEAHKDDGGSLMEKFIPITRRALVSRLGQEEEMLTVEERNGLGQFAGALDAFISRRFYAQLERMKVSMQICICRERPEWLGVVAIYLHLHYC